MAPAPRAPFITTETGNKVSRRAQLHGTQHIFMSGRAVIAAGVCIRGDLRGRVRESVNTTASSTTTATGTAETKVAATAAAKGEVEAKVEAKGKGESKVEADSKAAYTTAVSIGRYTFLSPHCILRPPWRLSNPSSGPGPGAEIVYERLMIGDHVFIGEGAIVEAKWVGDHVYVGKGAVLGRGCVVREWSVVLEGSVVPEGLVVAGGCVVGGAPGRVVGEVGDGWWGGEGGDGRERWRGFAG